MAMSPQTRASLKVHSQRSFQHPLTQCAPSHGLLPLGLPSWPSGDTSAVGRAYPSEHRPARSVSPNARLRRVSDKAHCSPTRLRGLTTTSPLTRATARCVCQRVRCLESEWLTFSTAVFRLPPGVGFHVVSSAAPLVLLL